MRFTPFTLNEEIGVRVAINARFRTLRAFEAPFPRYRLNQIKHLATAYAKTCGVIPHTNPKNKRKVR